ncbi:unnamed protein product [Peniophora sp. CBMAI 1063]|nr:unnamed protein product [Peniophora sp. CBMAI 1063]
MGRRHIPDAQKELLMEMLDNGMPQDDLVKFSHVSDRTCRRVKKLYRQTGKVSRKALFPGRPRALGDLPLAYLEARIEQSPDLTLRELRQALVTAYAIDVTEQTISNSLKRRGWSRKKLSRPALEQDEEKRAAFRLEIAQYAPWMLVFLDESAADRRTARRTYGWAPIGDRARRHDYFVRKKRYSILPAISLSGVVYLDIIARSWNGEQFDRYLDALLDMMQPYPNPNSVLVMDNSSVHHFEGVRQKVEARGCRLVYLSPYSPDYNPLEEGFSAMKAWIRRNREYVLGRLRHDDP